MEFLDKGGGGGGGGTESIVVGGLSATAGFVGSGFLGNEVEHIIKSGVNSSSSITDKLIAWGVNNLPKVALYYSLGVLGSGREIEAAKLGTAINIIVDSALRGAGGGTSTGKLFGYDILTEQKKLTSTASADIQRMIQENSSLRTELGKALQRLAAIPIGQGQLTGGQGSGAAPIVYVQPVQQVQNPLQIPNQQALQAQVPQSQVQHANVQTVKQSLPVTQLAQPIRTAQSAAAPQVVKERDRRFGFMGEDEDRERKFSSMPTYDAPPHVKSREQRFGMMGDSNTKDIATMFGML